MARPRKPTNVLELNGALKRNPARGRARAGEPVPKGKIGPAPKYMSLQQRACYAELVRKAHEGVLCPADQIIVEAAAILLARTRSAPGMFSAGEFARLSAVLGLLGMTPGGPLEGCCAGEGCQFRSAGRVHDGVKAWSPLPRLPGTSPSLSTQ